VREPQGIAYLPSTHRLFVAGGESNAVIAFDGEKRVAAAGGLQAADNLRLDAASGQLVVGYSDGLAFLDQMTLAVVQRILLRHSNWQSALHLVHLVPAGRGVARADGPQRSVGSTVLPVSSFQLP
jgi:hypothetical protein